MRAISVLQYVVLLSPLSLVIIPKAPTLIIGINQIVIPPHSVMDIAPITSMVKMNPHQTDKDNRKAVFISLLMALRCASLLLTKIMNIKKQMPHA